MRIAGKLDGLKAPRKPAIMKIRIRISPETVKELRKALLKA